MRILFLLGKCMSTFNETAPPPPPLFFLLLLLLLFLLLLFEIWSFCNSGCPEPQCVDQVDFKLRHPLVSTSQALECVCQEGPGPLVFILIPLAQFLTGISSFSLQAGKENLWETGTGKTVHSSFLLGQYELRGKHPSLLPLSSRVDHLIKYVTQEDLSVSKMVY